MDYREADQRPRLGGLAEALFHRRDVFARHVAALDLAEELEARAALAGDDLDLDLAELARAARLLLVGIGQFHRLAEIFAIRHLRRADIRFDLVLTIHAIDHDFEVNIAHSLSDGLARFVIGRNADRRQTGRGSCGERGGRDGEILVVPVY